MARTKRTARITPRSSSRHKPKQVRHSLEEVRLYYTANFAVQRRRVNWNCLSEPQKIKLKTAEGILGVAYQYQTGKDFKEAIGIAMEMIKSIPSAG